MLGTASANAPEYQPVASKSPERKDDVLENICPARAQLESKHADVSFPPVQSVGGNAESNNQEEQEVHSKNKHCMFRNNTARHIWLKYMRLMTGKKQDENHENTSCGEEVEKDVLPRKARYMAYDWSGVFRVGRKPCRKHRKKFVETIKKFLHIPMNIFGYSNTFVEGFEDLVFSDDKLGK